MEIKILFSLSKDIHPKFEIINIGKYKIEPLPTDSRNLAGSKLLSIIYRYQKEFGENNTKTGIIRKQKGQKGDSALFKKL